MTRSLPTIRFLILVLLGLGKAVAADPGRDTIGKLTVRVYFGTDGDPSVTGDKAVEVSEETADKLKSQEQLIVIIEERWGVALGAADASRESLGTAERLAATIEAKR